MASKEWDDWQGVTEFKQSPKMTRFKHPVIEEKILELSKGFVPANTKKITTWAYKVFSDWLTERNNNADEQCPEDLLNNPNVFKLNYWLTRFVAEVRRQDGKLFRIAFFKCFLPIASRVLFLPCGVLPIAR